ncbi:MAG: polysaccharide deacetylase family protein [Proteobacteria bacterium]|nr:polysaccharide deacetylase family protein [Pseudomonadota bacterium]
MTKLFSLVLVSITAVATWFYFSSDTLKSVDIQSYSVLVIFNPSEVEQKGYILNGYASILDEEGIPFEMVTGASLLASEAKLVARAHPALIFPDGVSRHLPDDLEIWLRRYLKHGGNLLVVFDSGSTDHRLNYKKVPLFTSMTGIDYCLYDELIEEAFTTASLRFVDEQATAHFQIPPGKLTTDLKICGYAYENLQYQISRNRPAKSSSVDRIYAWAELKNGERIPALTLRTQGKGKVMYVNLPLGELKTVSTDDMIARSVLRTFLLQEVKIVHLANTPQAKGGFIFNWHIDNNLEWDNIPRFAERNYLRENMPASIHITAGDFVNMPSDGKGFRACRSTKGRDTVKIAEKYGEIGSHGGWRHDWFESGVRSGRLKEKQIDKYIKMNSECLEEVTKKKVVEYSAPGGVHPQPITTKILERHGIYAYYFTGDSGSSPNRTFSNGEMVSSKTIAFPVMPFRTLASFHEMHVNHVSPEELTKWLLKTVDYIANNRLVRLVYSHLYDLAFYPEYQQSFETLLEHLDELQQQEKLNIAPMRVFAEYLLRFLKTKQVYVKTEKGWSIKVSNPDTLKDITVAVPKKHFLRIDDDAHSIDEEDEDYYYVRQNNEGTHMALSLTAL